MQFNDSRYQYSRCSKCGGTWQNIDFGCALHRMTCEAFDAAERMTIAPRDYPADTAHPQK